VQAQTSESLITFSCGPERLAIVRLTDGACCIARNGQLIQGCEWPADRAADCAARYARLVMMRLAHEMNGSTLPTAVRTRPFDA
jgi:hypothetical protein